MGDIEVNDHGEFLRVAKALHAQGTAGQGLRKELRAELKEAAKPMEAAVLEHISQYLPSGYAPVMAAGLKVRPSQSLRGSGAGLKLTGYAKGVTRRRHIRVIDRGTLRHPVWGNREAWVSQKVKPGFWSEVLSKSDVPLDKIREAVRNVASKLGG